jgi:processed acidic surface protein
MKKLGVIILTLSLLVGMFPKVAMAAQNADFEQQLTQYLAEISAERGFEVTKGDLEASLATYELNLDDYESIEELKSGFGEVIKADLSNLNSLYETYELDEATLPLLLADNGEELTDYIFLNDLDMAIFFYSKEDDIFERDPDFDQNLVDYLAKISIERGFEVTKETLEATLVTYDTNLEDFETVEDLSDYLGEVIKPDLSNLKLIYETYELDEQTLLQLIKDNGKTINDYIFVDDIEEVIWSFEEENPIFDEETLKSFLEQIGITDNELQTISDYFMSLEEYFSDPAILERYEAIGERLLALEDVPLTDTLTEEQTNEFLTIMNDAISILKLDIKFSLIKDGSEKQLSMLDLINLKDLEDANLKVSIYGENSLFLADFVITSDFIDSMGGLIEETDDVIEAVDLPAVINPVKQVSNEVKTVSGGKLPKTASNFSFNILLGLFIAFGGIMMYRKVRNDKSELIKK